MDDRQVAVAQQVDVQFDAVAVVQGGAEGCHGIFRHAGAVKSPVGVGPAPEVLQSRMTAAAADGEEIKSGEDENKF